jgi:hypothetical protein
VAVRSPSMRVIGIDARHGQQPAAGQHCNTAKADNQRIRATHSRVTQVSSLT